MMFAHSTTPPVLTNKQKLHQYCEQMYSLKLDITGEVHNLARRLTSGSFSHHDYVQMLSSVKDNLNVQFMDLMQTILVYDSQNLEDRLNELEQFRRDQMMNIFNI